MATKQNLAVVPTPPTGKPPAITRDLLKLESVAKEMAKIYRAVRRGELHSQEGTRLTYILGRLGDVLELTEIEHRLLELEERANGGNR
jgi:hypothetical protein